MRHFNWQILLRRLALHLLVLWDWEGRVPLGRWRTNRIALIERAIDVLVLQYTWSHSQGVTGFKMPQNWSKSDRENPGFSRPSEPGWPFFDDFSDWILSRLETLDFRPLKIHLHSGCQDYVSGPRKIAEFLLKGGDFSSYFFLKKVSSLRELPS